MAAVIIPLGCLLQRFDERPFGGSERVVRAVPLVRTVHFGVRQVRESLVQRSAGYDGVDGVEFVTGERPVNGYNNHYETARVDVAYPDGPVPPRDRQALDRGLETPLEHCRGLGLWLAKWTVEHAHGRLRFPEEDASLRVELRRAGD